MMVSFKLFPTLSAVLQFIPIATAQLQFPALTGQHTVGTIALELPKTSSGRDLMVSFFYPTYSSNANKFSLAPAYPPASLAFFAESSGLPPNYPITITSQAYLNAPLLTPGFPLLFFSPGYGASRLQYTTTIEDIASQGYIIVSVDHPLDSEIIEYPDGRVITQTVPSYTNRDSYIPIVDARVQDVLSVFDALSNTTFTSQIPGFGKHSKFSLDKVGIMGHSLGGATSASTMLANSHFIAGLNFDGSMIGPVVTQGLKKPFLLFAAEGHNRTNDDSWATFWGNLKGWKRELSVKGTLHISYTDYLVLGDALIAASVLPVDVLGELGTIDGTRLLNIEGKYVGAFWDKCFKDGEGKVLDGPSKDYPEVTFQN